MPDKLLKAIMKELHALCLPLDTEIIATSHLSQTDALEGILSILGKGGSCMFPVLH